MTVAAKRACVRSAVASRGLQHDAAAKVVDKAGREQSSQVCSQESTSSSSDDTSSYSISEEEEEERAVCNHHGDFDVVVDLALKSHGGAIPANQSRLSNARDTASEHMLMVAGRGLRGFK